MGNVITVVCCSASHGENGENNVDEEVEDKITVEIDNYDDPQIKMPVLHKSYSERTILANWKY